MNMFQVFGVLPHATLLTDLDIITLATWAKAERVHKALDLGTHCGASAAILAHCCDRVTTVDLFENFELIENEDSRKHYAEQFEKDRCTFDAVSSFLREFGNVTVVLSEIQSYLNELREQGLMFNLIFVDGSHDYQSVRDNIEASIKVLYPGGLLLLHDACGGTQWEGVKQAAEELEADRRLITVSKSGPDGTIEVFIKR